MGFDLATSTGPVTVFYEYKSGQDDFTLGNLFAKVKGELLRHARKTSILLREALGEDIANRVVGFLYPLSTLSKSLPKSLSKSCRLSMALSGYLFVDGSRYMYM